MGEDWERAVRAAVQACKQHGVKLWLYDEDGWPSGTAGGRVPQAGPGCRIKCLFARRIGAPVPPGATPLGQPLEGLQVYRWVAPLGDERYRGLCYSDLLDRQTVATFIEASYAWYADRFGDEFGKTIVGQLTNRVTEHYGLLPAGAVPFSTHLLETFELQHGYDPVPHLLILFSEEQGLAPNTLPHRVEQGGPGSARQFRLHYFRTVSRMFAENFVQLIESWCAQHRIQLGGHLMWEESLLKQRYIGPSLMPAYR
ncbi:MAG: hypothetical protein AAF797_06405 [Planctomycetota bacterium]